MGIENFLHFIEEHCTGAYVPVDLLKITQAVGLKMPRRMPSNVSMPIVPFNPSNLCLVIDGECCLDRLYGGYFNDWACGGQWNRMVQFLQILLTTIHNNNIMVVVVFNGALEMNRFDEWAASEIEKRNKVKQILRHVRHKGTPPPKVLWIPPVGLRSALRMALRNSMVPVIQSVDDHKQEVISFLREHDFDAIVGEGAEYSFFDPPRYFSAERLKLTFRGSLESRELILDEVAKQLNLHPHRFCLLAAMLGNWMVTAEELQGFYDELLASTTVENKNDHKVIIPAVVAFIRNLISIDDLLAIGNFIFRNVTDESARRDKAQRFVKSVHYYMNGTREHYQRFFKPQARRPPLPSSHHADGPTIGDQFASEATGGELHDVKDIAPRPPKHDMSTLERQMWAMSMEDERSKNGPAEVAREPSPMSSTGSDDSGGLGFKDNGMPRTPHSAAVHAVHSELKNNQQKILKPSAIHEHTVPQVPMEVFRMAVQRHQKGLMHPWIFHILGQAELKMDCFIEDGSGMDFPPGWMIFRPLRQAVYAVLFNLNHKNFLLRQQREGKTPENKNQQIHEPGKYPSDLSTRIFIKEWVYWSKHNAYQFPEFVPALALDWRGVPTIQRLWFGQNPDDKKKRLKAFLNCMASDNNLMLNQQNVPQHLLLMCCVLRYMAAFPERQILQRHELDAFLATAVSPQLMDPNTTQDMQIRNLSPRGIELAQLFMQGVEHALFANDACGAPIPWVMSCPWLFFDGKLFQNKLDTAEKKKRLQDICGGDTDQVQRVERMRQAILEGLEGLFVQNQMPRGMPWMHPGMRGFGPMGPPGAPGRGGYGMPPGAARFAASLRGRGMLGRRDLMSRGGQLEIAGVVVGQWGGNVDKEKHRPRPAGGRLSPQIASVGSVAARYGRGGRGSFGPRGGGGYPFGFGGPPGPMMRGDPHMMRGGGGYPMPFMMDYGGFPIDYSFGLMPALAGNGRGAYWSRGFPRGARGGRRPFGGARGGGRGGAHFDRKGSRSASKSPEQNDEHSAEPIVNGAGDADNRPSSN